MNFYKFFSYSTYTTQIFSEQFSITLARPTHLTSFSIDTRFYTYDGRFTKSILIKPYHIGFKIGQFIFTRLQSSAIHLRKRKKKERKKRGK